MKAVQAEFDGSCKEDDFFSKFTAYKTSDGGFYKCSFVRSKFLKWIKDNEKYEASYDGNGDCNYDCLCFTCVDERLK